MAVSFVLCTLTFAVCSLLSCPVTAVRSRKPSTELQGLDRFEDTFEHRDDRSEARPAMYPAPEAHDTALQTGSICAARASGRRVVSIADQHGDFDGLLMHLQALGLVKSTASRRSSSWVDLWNGGDAVFVQTGDILDRGPDGKMMYKFLWALQDQAKSQGGEVVLLVGNHELMVLQGDIRYVTNTDFCSYTRDNCGSAFPRDSEYCDNCCTYSNGMCNTNSSSCMPGNCEFLQAWDKWGEMGSEMRRRFTDGRMKLVHKEGDVIFSHAGLVSSLWGKLGSWRDPVEELNSQAAKLFTRNDGRSLRYSDHIVAETSGQNGPLWTRVCYDNWYTKSGRRRSGSRRRQGDNMKYYIDRDETERVEYGRCATIAKSLQTMSAKRMVIGHCPTGDGVVTDCGGSIVLADTYMSIAYAGSRSNAISNMAALEFYTGATDRVWAVYSGRRSWEKCEQLE